MWALTLAVATSPPPAAIEDRVEAALAAPWRQLRPELQSDAVEELRVALAAATPPMEVYLRELRDARLSLPALCAALRQWGRRGLQSLLAAAHVGVGSCKNAILCAGAPPTRTGPSLFGPDAHQPRGPAPLQPTQDAGLVLCTGVRTGHPRPRASLAAHLEQHACVRRFSAAGSRGGAKGGTGAISPGTSGAGRAAGGGGGLSSFSVSYRGPFSVSSGEHAADVEGEHAWAVRATVLVCALLVFACVYVGVAFLVAVHCGASGAAPTRPPASARRFLARLLGLTAAGERWMMLGTPPAREEKLGLLGNKPRPALKRVSSTTGGRWSSVGGAPGRPRLSQLPAGKASLAKTSALPVVPAPAPPPQPPPPPPPPPPPVAQQNKGRAGRETRTTVQVPAPLLPAIDTRGPCRGHDLPPVRWYEGGRRPARVFVAEGTPRPATRAGAPSGLRCVAPVPSSPVDSASSWDDAILHEPAPGRNSHLWVAHKVEAPMAMPWPMDQYSLG